ncbi:MAG: protein kinase, partial [Gemmatimonadota bacterium]
QHHEKTQVWISDMSDPLRERLIAAIGQHYELGTEIGRGGMSVVYRARDLRLNRQVAIKVLPPELAYDPAIRTRFTREAQTSAQLTHAHIVPIYDVGEREGIAFLVMALVSGGNLGAHLAREPQQPIDEVRRLVAEIADALDYAHTRGVIHRDIKPDNVLLDEHTGRAMVNDFGIARAIEAGTRLTVTGNAVGTPTYMSPEQALGEREVDGRSDIYSLGCVAYQMITGRLPFNPSNTMALLHKHVNERPRPIADLRPDAPRALREAIERALQKSPEDRWPTAGALRDAISVERSGVAAWRVEQREKVRYASPKAGVARLDPKLVSPRRAAPALDRAPLVMQTPNAIELEPQHLATLTPAQREDVRLWHGRVNLMERIKAARGYAWATVASVFGSMAGVVFGFEEGIPPLVFAPIVPMFMSYKLWMRGKSLRAAGLKLRRVFLMPRAKWVIPGPVIARAELELAKLAPRELLDGSHGAAIRRAADDRAAIQEIVSKLSKPDRALLPDLEPTVKGLVERVVTLVQMLQRLEQSFDPRLLDELDAREMEAELEKDTVEGQRRIALLKRQRNTMEELLQQRATLAAQIESACLALGNLRLDLIKLRSSGLQSAFADVSTATQEARALSREIGVVLDAVAEVRKL